LLNDKLLTNPDCTNHCNGHILSCADCRLWSVLGRQNIDLTWPWLIVASIEWHVVVKLVSIANSLFVNSSSILNSTSILNSSSIFNSSSIPNFQFVVNVDRLTRIDVELGMLTTRHPPSFGLLARKRGRRRPLGPPRAAWLSEALAKGFKRWRAPQLKSDRSCGIVFLAKHDR
jgi:hypothetical protein